MSHKIGQHEFSSRDEAYRWLFSNKEGAEVVFTDGGIGYRIFDEGVDFDGVVEIGGAKASVKFCHDADNGEVEVRFPNSILGKSVPLWETVGVGWLTKDADGRFWFSLSPTRKS